MNKDNLQKLIDTIDQCEPEEFNMEDWAHIDYHKPNPVCGTPSCACGWANYLADPAGAKEITEKWKALRNKQSSIDTHIYKNSNELATSYSELINFFSNYNRVKNWLGVKTYSEESENLCDLFNLSALTKNEVLDYLRGCYKIDKFIAPYDYFSKETW